jgi:hypothetical protein
MTLTSVSLCVALNCRSALDFCQTFLLENSGELMETLRIQWNGSLPLYKYAGNTALIEELLQRSKGVGVLRKDNHPRLHKCKTAK